MTKEELIHIIALSLIPNIGPVTAKSLISYCGGIENVFAASTKKLMSTPGFGPNLLATFDRITALELAKKEMQNLEDKGIHATCYLEKKYPQRLSNFDYSPIVIYHKGNFDFNHNKTVAIVGTRTPSDYGRLMTDRIVEGLKEFNVQIISGLAYGVDALAHKKSVDLDIPTVGVLGHGLDILYPSQHTNLVKKMISNGGIVSEFPFGTRPDREHFPMRNRIIAMMSDAVVVIESKNQGGSMITGEFGNEYNKDVFAVPGLVTEERAQGCHKLIKLNKAHLVESGIDIAEIMGWSQMAHGKVIQKQLFLDLSTEESALYELIKLNKEMPIDNITFALNKPPSEVAALLLELEFKGAIRALPGKRYTLY